jgi:hypothetical protein
MVDTREDILARLAAVLATIPNINAVYRNNVDIPETDLPAAIVLDGDEETADSTDFSTKPPNRPTMVSMTPEIIIAQQADEVGSDISTLRRELIKRVLTDNDLNNIVQTGRGGNGRNAGGAIRYLGCQTDLGWMRSLFGALRAQFLFRYVLKADDL